MPCKLPSSDSIYAKDQEGKYLLANRATANMIGQPPEAIIGKNDTELYGSENAKAALGLPALLHKKLTKAKSGWA